MASDSEFFKKLRATFAIEADEHLTAMFAGLLELEKADTGDSAAVLERVYREAHSLKGAARAVELHDIATLCHALEEVFSAWKGGQITAAPPLFDLLQQALTALSAMLLSDGAVAPDALLQRLAAACHGVRLDAPAPLDAAAPAPAETAVASVATLRVDASRLDAVMRQTEELLAPRLSAAQRVAELRAAADAVAAWERHRARIQPALRALASRQAQDGVASFSALTDYLDAETAQLKAVATTLTRLQKSAEHDHRQLDGIVDMLLTGVRQMHLQPFSTLFDGVARQARALALELGKKVDCVIEGGDIEVDRRILEQMKDPLTHLLRNGIDHGIEPPARREALGKSPQGRLRIAVTQRDSGKIEIEVADDGRGVDLDGLARVVERMGLSQGVPREKTALLKLLFRSGVSTRSIVTDLSGRGLGLSIVQEKVEALAGTITVDSDDNAGTRFRIVLPLSIATFRGVLVGIGERRFIVPAAAVERVVHVSLAAVVSLEQRDTIAVDGQALAIVRLGDVLGLPRQGGATAGRVPALVCEVGGARIVYCVEAVLGEQDVLVKGLGRQLARVRNLSGACILASGDVVPVLNMHDVAHAAMQAPSSALTATTAGEAPRSILVAEDSITSRTLMKTILESAGYRVVTAVDGADALAALHDAAFDLLVSDVEMPRLDGFELTTRVRADPALAELPVVLVTALASNAHRERGIDVGANAYIVKSSFDQSTLLDVIERLL
jgi:two-component system chemotaxis sensor kinase CheA